MTADKCTFWEFSFLPFFCSDRIMSQDISSITGAEWAWMALVGIQSMIGYVFQTLSLEWIVASGVGSLKSLEVLFAYLVQTVVMLHPVQTLAIVGATMILAGVAGISAADVLAELVGKKCVKNCDEETIDEDIPDEVKVPLDSCRTNPTLEPETTVKG